MTTSTVLEPVLLRQMLRWRACGCGQAGPECWYCGEVG